MADEKAPARLSQRQLHKVYKAVISARLDPGTFLAELPPEIATSLAIGRSNADLVLHALSELNTMELDDGRRPLLIALETAATLTASRKEAKTFQHAIALLNGKLALAQAPDSSPSGSRRRLREIAVGCAVTAVASMALTLALHGVFFPKPPPIPCPLPDPCPLPAPCPIVKDRLAARAQDLKRCRRSVSIVNTMASKGNTTPGALRTEVTKQSTDCLSLLEALDDGT
jgi:hypothetical protein